MAEGGGGGRRRGRSGELGAADRPLGVVVARKLLEGGLVPGRRRQQLTREVDALGATDGALHDDQEADEDLPLTLDPR